MRGRLVGGSDAVWAQLVTQVTALGDGWREGIAGGGSEGGAVPMEREVLSVGAGSAEGEAAFDRKKLI